jgi:hypothetical protein
LPDGCVDIVLIKQIIHQLREDGSSSIHAPLLPKAGMECGRAKTTSTNSNRK